MLSSLVTHLARASWTISELASRSCVSIAQSFNRMARMALTHTEIVQALTPSTEVEVDAEGKRVRRRIPFKR